jgi:hypothetical protein
VDPDSYTQRPASRQGWEAIGMDRILLRPGCRGWV